MKVTFGILTMNRLPELQQVLRRVSPYVDKTIVIDGCSIDGTVKWLDSEECRNMNIEFKCIEQHLYQYGNHNPDKRNPYIYSAGNEGWMLVMDDDEILEEEAAKNLKLLAEEAEQKGYDGIKFRPHDIWYRYDGSILKDAKHPTYWSPMFWKIYPGQHYEGATHVRIVRPGAKNKWLETDYYYKHIKTEMRLWRNSTQNYWTTTKIADNTTNDEDWRQFHNMMKKYNHIDWHKFDLVMKNGNLPAEIKDWFIKYKDDESPEKRSWFVWYFIFLRPEENINKLSNVDYRWDYINA